MTLGATILNVEPAGVSVPASAWTHDGFRSWVKSDRFPRQAVRATYVEGEVFLEMAPDSIESHNKPKTAITIGLGRLVEEEDLGELYSDRALLTLPAANLTTEPDACFASWSTFESERLKLLPRANRDDDYAELEGVPDLVVEIVSDSSIRKDLVRLRAAYALGGVREYWLVDARGPEVSFEILLLSDGAYPERGEPGPQRSPVLGRAFTLARTRNRMGRWSYRLEVAG